MKRGVQLAAATIEKWARGRPLECTGRLSQFPRFQHHELVCMHQAALTIQHWFFRRLLERELACPAADFRVDILAIGLGEHSEIGLDDLEEIAVSSFAQESPSRCEKPFVPSEDEKSTAAQSLAQASAVLRRMDNDQSQRGSLDSNFPISAAAKVAKEEPVRTRRARAERQKAKREGNMFRSRIETVNENGEPTVIEICTRFIKKKSKKVIDDRNTVVLYRPQTSQARRVQKHLH